MLVYYLALGVPPVYADTPILIATVQPNSSIKITTSSLSGTITSSIAGIFDYASYSSTGALTGCNHNTTTINVTLNGSDSKD